MEYKRLLKFDENQLSNLNLACSSVSSTTVFGDLYDGRGFRVHLRLRFDERLTDLSKSMR